MLIYLGLSALAASASAVLLLLFGEPSLLAAMHLVLAVAILPLIFGAIAHFVPVLTRSASAPRSWRRCCFSCPACLSSSIFPERWARALCS